MKRFISILLSLCLLFGCAFVAVGVEEGSDEDGGDGGDWGERPDVWSLCVLSLEVSEKSIAKARWLKLSEDEELGSPFALRAAQRFQARVNGVLYDLEFIEMTLEEIASEITLDELKSVTSATYTVSSQLKKFS